MAGITFTELLDYTDDETRRWKEFFQKNPAALDVATDVQGVKTVRELVTHIFMAELVFGNGVLDEPRPDFEKVPKSTLDEIFAIGDDARKKMRAFLSHADDWQLGEVVSFGRAGDVSRRKMLIQALTHGMRHWAQVATELRRAGYPTDWVHDLLMSPAIR
jgi:uncharacterized damage-inducible protein DinB